MNSPLARIRKRFFKNKSAVAGLCFIALMLVVCLLGYLITPDQSPYANTMTLQLSTKKPGSAFTFLKIPTSTGAAKENLFSIMWYGQIDNFKNVPIEKYEITGDSIITQEFIGVEEPAERQAYPLHVFIKNHEELTAMELKQAIGQQYIVRKTFWLGTDIYGRDLLSRILLGVRVSFSVGIIAVLISLTIGVFIGSAAGYFGGKVDLFLSWIMNVVWALPALLLVIAISFALGKGFWQIFVAVGLSMWVEVARLVRGQMLTYKNIEFVEAAKALGYRDWYIIRNHILPNITGPILVIASSNFASAILLEAGLSFLGFGAQPPIPTWGGMIKEHYGYIIMDAAYLAILPGLAIMLLVYAFNLVAVGLRDAFDVKSQNLNV